jgi:hypothetical protein
VRFKRSKFWVLLFNLQDLRYNIANINLNIRWNHSEFLSEPPIVDAFAYEAREENKIIRESTEVNFGETRFLSNTDDHADQYFKLYTNRLQELKPAVLEKAKQEWIETGKVLKSRNAIILIK